MRKIEDLLGMKEKVWFYLKDEELMEKFMREAANEGFTWMSGKTISPEDTGHIIGITKDKRIGHVSLYIWNMVFGNRENYEDSVLTVDYEKYIAGEEDYICREAHFTKIS